VRKTTNERHKHCCPPVTCQTRSSAFTPSRPSRKKALKAVLASAGAEFPFTHNLGLLMQLCEDAGLDLPQSLSEVDMLTPYAAQVRYGSVPAVTASRSAMLDLASEATEWAAAILQPG